MNGKSSGTAKTEGRRVGTDFSRHRREKSAEANRSPDDGTGAEKEMKILVLFQ
jgi:hypothetical protein